MRLIRYPTVWIRNPLHVALVFVYGILSLGSAYGIVSNLLAFDRLYETFALLNRFLPLHDAVRVFARVYEDGIEQGVLLSILFTSLSMVYILPLIRKGRDWIKLLLVIPFCLGYFPIYALVSILGAAHFLAINGPAAGKEHRAW